MRFVDMMEFIAAGVVTGAIYAILGCSLALTYSATGVLNLATGVMAYIVADVYYYLVGIHSWSLLAAGLVCVLVVSPGLGFLLWALVFRQLEKSDLVTQVVATIGLSVALAAGIDTLLQHDPVEQAPGLVANGLFPVQISSISVSRFQLVAVIGAVVCVVGLVLVIDRTRLGLATRAVVDRPRLAEGRGINTDRVSAASWMLASLLAGIAGLLLAPLVTLQSSDYVELTVTALSVALVGRFRGFIRIAVAGVVLGIAASLLVGYAPSSSTLIQQLAPALPFFLLTVLLLIGWSPIEVRRDSVQPGVARKGLAAPLTGGLSRSSGMPGRPRSLAGLGRAAALPAAALVVVIVFTFGFSSYWTLILAAGLAYAVIFLSFTVATGQAGVLCLGQATFVAIGGFIAGRLIEAQGWPLVPAVIVGVLAAAAVGLVIGFIGSRLDQVGFALITLAFALFCEYFVYSINAFLPAEGVSFPVISVFGLSPERSDVVLSFVVFVILATAISVLARGRFGRAYAALRANPLSSSSLGLNVRGLRTAAFGISAAIAGLGGVLLGITESQLGEANVALEVGLVLVAVAVSLGVRGWLGAFLAGLTYSVIPAAVGFIPATWTHNLPTIAFGLGAVALAKQPEGAVAQVRSDLSRLLTRIRGPVPSPAPAAPLQPVGHDVARSVES